MSSSNIIPHLHKILKADRQNAYGQKSFVLWYTGLSGSGKSTLAGKTEEELFCRGLKTYILDGDNIRTGLNKNLSFSEDDRKENIRRIGEVSKLFVDAGIIVLTAFISPFIEDRKTVRNLLEPDEFIEIYVNCPLEVCEQRDVKGLYQKARKGEIKDFTGIHSQFENPVNPEIEIQTNLYSIDDSVKRITDFLMQKKLI